jgi:hypothetical protein
MIMAIGRHLDEKLKSASSPKRYSMQNPDPSPRRKLKIENPFSDADIRKIEEVIGRKLPKDYLDFVKTFGSPFVAGSVNGLRRFPVLEILSAKDLVNYMRINTELAADGPFAIARSEMGNPYVIAEDDAVYYLDYYSNMHGHDKKAERVGDSFSDFIARIVLDED